MVPQQVQWGTITLHPEAKRSVVGFFQRVSDISQTFTGKMDEHPRNHSTLPL